MMVLCYMGIATSLKGILGEIFDILYECEPCVVMRLTILLVLIFSTSIFFDYKLYITRTCMLIIDIL